MRQRISVQMDTGKKSRVVSDDQPATLETVLAGEIAPAEKAVYRALWTARQPLTAPEIRHQLGKDRHISTRLRDLELRGMVKRGSRRVCTVSQRTCNTWEITGTGVKPLVKTRAKELSDIPTAHEIKLYVRDIAVLTAIAYSKGARLSPAVVRVSNWLKAGAPGLPNPNGQRVIREKK